MGARGRDADDDTAVVIFVRSDRPRAERVSKVLRLVGRRRRRPLHVELCEEPSEPERGVSSERVGRLDELLERSRFLLVVCSPAARSSEWISETVERFRDPDVPDRRVVPLLVEGDWETVPLAMLRVLVMAVEAEALGIVDVVRDDARATTHEY